MSIAIFLILEGIILMIIGYLLNGKFDIVPYNKFNQINKINPDIKREDLRPMTIGFGAGLSYVGKINLILGLIQLGIIIFNVHIGN